MQELLELLKASLPDAIGGIIAAAVLGLATIAFARFRRRKRSQSSEDQVGSQPGAQAQGLEFGVDVQPQIGTTLVSKGSLDVGMVDVEGKVGFGFSKTKTEVIGQAEDLEMSVPGGYVKIGSSPTVDTSSSVEGVTTDDGS